MTEVSRSARARASGGTPVGVAATQPGFHLLEEPGQLGLTGWHRKVRHVVGAFGERHLAPLGHLQRVVAGLPKVVLVRPQRTHLSRRLQVEVSPVELEPLRVGHGLAGLHAEQHLVRVGVLGVRVMQVVRGKQRQVEIAAQPQQVLDDPLLDVEAVVHQLQVEVAGPEDVAELGRTAPRVLVVADAQPGLDLTGGAPGRPEQSVRVFGEELAVGARLVEEPLGARSRREPEQVVHAGVVGRQQRHVGERAATGYVVVTAGRPAHSGSLEPGGAGCEVRLHADDRFDAGRARPRVELVGPELIAVISHRERRHTHPGRLGQQLRQPGRAVEHGVLRVHVQMHERVGFCTFHGGYGFLSARLRHCFDLRASRRRHARAAPVGVGYISPLPESATHQSPRDGRIRVCVGTRRP